MLRCFVSARNTHGKLTSATLGATSSNCLAHHLMSMTRSIVIHSSSYKASHKLLVTSLGSNARIVRTLRRHLVNHCTEEGVGRPRAGRIVMTRGKLVARSVTIRVISTNVRGM